MIMISGFPYWTYWSKSPVAKVAVMQGSIIMAAKAAITKNVCMAFSFLGGCLLGCLTVMRFSPLPFCLNCLMVAGLRS